MKIEAPQLVINPLNLYNSEIESDDFLSIIAKTYRVGRQGAAMPVIVWVKNDSTTLIPWYFMTNAERDAKFNELCDSIDRFSGLERL